MTLTSEVFDADGDPLDVLWEIFLPDGSTVEIPRSVVFGGPPAAVEIGITEFFPLGTTGREP